MRGSGYMQHRRKDVQCCTAIKPLKDVKRKGRRDGREWDCRQQGKCCFSRERIILDFLLNNFALVLHRTNDGGGALSFMS